MTGTPLDISKLLFFFVFFWAAPMAYGGSLARGQIGATAGGLCHGHSNTRSEPRLRPTPQLTATLGMEPETSWLLVRFVFAEPRWELLDLCFICVMKNSVL